MSKVPPTVTRRRSRLPATDLGGVAAAGGAEAGGAATGGGSTGGDTAGTTAGSAGSIRAVSAGAGAVSELAAAGKPSILVPFPFAADDHQTRNAEAMERGGASRLVRDAEMNGEKLVSLVGELAGAAGCLETMAEAARKFAHPGAARRAADILEEVALDF